MAFEAVAKVFNIPIAHVSRFRGLPFHTLPAKVEKHVQWLLFKHPTPPNTPRHLHPRSQGHKTSSSVHIFNLISARVDDAVAMEIGGPEDGKSYDDLNLAD
ncbi:hypothetical protein PGT21_008479 [Puccinia graminis f. sp. tritici]|uniref:Uncharacterized protein n=1 Tax=Puccinia graminis f. sp. tritici TaxID=56615 RepID=A0A5B0MTC1_PUCGR|nr:hypothetical protein PGT21_008479 [Puccinia graminis f. sp. tritici]